NGMAALEFDPLEEGERVQVVDANGKWKYWGSAEHGLDDVAANLLGQNIARYYYWDGMRGIDYLQSRPEIDPNRIGCTGNSGGGTQSCYLVALDDRVKASAPSCAMTFMAENGPGDPEQRCFGCLAMGLDYPDLLFM